MEGTVGMWALVMFDLPVVGKAQRRNATRFREDLIRSGWSRIQFSVYAKYVPGDEVPASVVTFVKDILPPEGEVRMVSISNRSWSKTRLFRGINQVDPEREPQQMVIFGNSELAENPGNPEDFDRPGV